MTRTLAIQDLIKTYGGKKVVDRVNLAMTGGEVVGLLGPNGAGKTTTFYMTIGMIRPDAGSVMLDSEDITGLPMHQRARNGLGYLPQEASVFKKLSVRDNLMVIIETLPLTKEQQREKTEGLLAELGIQRLSEQKAGFLSGGERRRLEISRTLATDPAFILLDEPFAGIDPLAVIDIQNIISHLSGRGIGILISDHNVRETLGACDKAYILNNGQVLESGEPEKIAQSPAAREIYLGEKFTL
ncbi:MAG: LPS export ABC transporter ATP-binding protein [Desulfobacteraceae bacterium]|nr:LPS export ABC transporter ATP-binding protein [Desulfobacteraceae bacterium]MCF8095281.1 LPS export ABC transporter ATP-binding protein [Desulfobacteraceae bacterium]